MNETRTTYCTPDSCVCGFATCPSRHETRTEHDAIGEIGIFVHEGREFAARGATVTAEYATAYPGDGGILKDWSGAAIGTWRKVASWFVADPRGYSRTAMYQIEAVIDGRTYTGRGQGLGMLWRGKAKVTR